ncbi:1,4-alpha-glucan branching enzyme [Alkalibacterium subtropicum]|uniref:1,4-alpha-glucan branching enzyme GlgB n=1 Tax=Alkalibacterium subtropicum TaxID=753702 RepID=A0A1I1HSA4_9LACT|nr:1,4-alpha-glucan branching protein GlgB [Alkalibacterium subtropicum]SFC26452.1 1,4-alpha-glucan branching enzyme [Alkalibacterium subtropicum]
MSDGKEKLEYDNKDLASYYLFNEGTQYDSYTTMGCKKVEDGYVFTVWAPHAQAVYLVGDFNEWSELDEMQKVEETGMFRLKDARAKKGQCYKYKVVQADGSVAYKIDPYAYEFEVRPNDAAVVRDLPAKQWKDGLWMANRRRLEIYNRPLNIYEVHLSSWKHHEDGSWYTIEELKRELIPYVKKLGYTHIEFMPLMEHPLDASWGYQATGFFGLSSKYGTIEELQDFVETAHQENIGVIMDWVPGHFNRNDYGMAYFDGTPQFEYSDPNQANNNRWGTLNFDLGKNQVRSYLISNALFWLEQFHLDGLRVDAVSNMLYLDYDLGDWTPNDEGTNINKSGVEFIQIMNKKIFERHPDVLMMAEESTAWPKVTHPVHEGGLGFNYKWNMGWMNDTLRFFEMDPLYRKDHFNLITFSFMYTFNENYVLPFSHDEVVHGKKSMMHKMFGDRYNQFAGLRTIETYRMMHPGKKLQFMGAEFGQFLEWRFQEGLVWDSLNDSMNAKHLAFTQQLNAFYKEHRALWEVDHQPAGTEILQADNADESLLFFIRNGKKPRDFLVVLCNFVPVERQNVKVGVPFKGQYEEVWNTEWDALGGTWTTPQGVLKTTEESVHGKDYAVEVILPALSVVVLKPKRVYGVPKNK